VEVGEHDEDGYHDESYVADRQAVLAARRHHRLASATTRAAHAASARELGLGPRIVVTLGTVRPSGSE
jgi:hypothetical protein